MNESFNDWLNRQQSISDQLSTFPAQALAATLDKQADFEDGDTLPPLWHWLYFLQAAQQSALAADGHPQRGDFLPPISLPRRMWAGSRLEFPHAVELGMEAERSSSIQSINHKQGKSGELVFVTIAHKVSQQGMLCIAEEQDLVFRENATGTPGTMPVQAKAEFEPDFSQSITPDPSLLFRYSALTFNSHRIHYDRDYAVNQEHYPGLLVHAPLLATLLAELLSKTHPNSRLARFQFKALAPVIAQQALQLRGTNPDTTGKSELWVENSSGGLCLQAQAHLQ